VTGVAVVVAVAEREALIPARHTQLKPLAAAEELDCHRPADRMFWIRGTITRMQAQFDDINKMPRETREKLLNQAKSLLRRRR
jgi:hypothetical protein